MIQNKIDDYISSHPKETLFLVALILFFIWQSLPALLGLTAFVLMRKRIPIWMTLLVGTVIGTAALIAQCGMHINFVRFFHEGFRSNVLFWKYLNAQNPIVLLNYIYQYEFNYLIGMPFLMAGIFSLIDLIPKNPHLTTMQLLQKGINQQAKKEIEVNKIDRILKKLNDEDHNGTLLGVSKYSGKTIVIPDRNVNQVALVLGTTGSGKTITLRRFYSRAIKKGYPLDVMH